MDSRFTSRLLWFLQPALQVMFLAAGILYAVCSFTSDWYYGQGLRTDSLADYQLSAALFPLLRSHRTGAAYWAAANDSKVNVGLIDAALQTDPNAADLWYNLARLRLQLGDTKQYNEALARLKELSPHNMYRVVGGG